MDFGKLLADFKKRICGKQEERGPKQVEKTKTSIFPKEDWVRLLITLAFWVVVFLWLANASKQNPDNFTLWYVFFTFIMTAWLAYTFTTKKENLDDLIKETGYKGIYFMFAAIINISLSFVLFSGWTKIVMEEIKKCPSTIWWTGSVVEQECKEHPIATTLIHSDRLKNTVPQAIFVILTLIIWTWFLVTAAHQYRLRLYYVHKKLWIDEPSLIPKSQ